MVISPVDSFPDLWQTKLPNYFRSGHYTSFQRQLNNVRLVAHVVTRELLPLPAVRV